VRRGIGQLPLRWSAGVEVRPSPPGEGDKCPKTHFASADLAAFRTGGRGWYVLLDHLEGTGCSLPRSNRFVEGERSRIG
jgi:hypothetical protein